MREYDNLPMKDGFGMVVKLKGDEVLDVSSNGVPYPSKFCWSRFNDKITILWIAADINPDTYEARMNSFFSEEDGWAKRLMFGKSYPEQGFTIFGVETTPMETADEEPFAVVV